MFLNNMNSCSNTDLEDCKYEPTGINAQFGYNTANLMTKENCCTNKDCCDKNNAIRDEGFKICCNRHWRIFKHPFR